MKSILRSIAIVVGIPTLLAAIYFSMFASDIYVSEAKFAIKSSKSGVSLTGMAAMFSGVDSGAGQDAVVVEDYIQSRDLMDILDQELGLQNYYSSEEIDAVARLKPGATREEFLDYMNKRIDVYRDESSNVITLKIEAFSAELAKNIALAIIKHSEKLVNRLSSRMEIDSLELAKAEVEDAAQQVRDVSERLSQLRASTNSIDPAAESSSVMGLLSGLEAKLAETRAELSVKRAYLREKSPELQNLINRQKALEEQLENERKRLAGDGSGNTMNGLIQQYQPLILEEQLAREKYTAALAALESARVEAHRKKQYLVTYVNPTLPDEAVEPQRLMSVLVVMLYAFLVYSVGGLIWAALKEHIGY
ncbi:hypothetical protein Q4485_09775 [Granulosicoccaceae sp. 1_MG-2023]|nr:hypothetical protein [Granulosicoccaceae sp. 1_MG-2023]